MSTILIVDDERDMVELLADELTARGHNVLAAYNGDRGIELAGSRPDLVILDIMMPGRDGFDVCRAIRDTVRCPILFVSARQSENDRVKGFSLGGDDYIVKPFGLREFLARIEANLRREERARQTAGTAGTADITGTAGTEKAAQTLLRWRNLELDLKGMAVTVCGEPVGLTRREYEIVELLALHAGQVFSREQMYERIWGLDAEGDSSTVVEHIKKIRAKLAAADPSGDYIQTVWGIGYKWNKG
ncbi:DNA-binding response regulator [Paenibacillus oralis]|uniref:DNA-binding response regulator n=1 Tax=Paenibacillus oralis TaxID=2490856 RepID=A0A3P3U3H3_9BACL|nr:response regulator transcription factor [Paenibacillus oralis]RRJ64088.1 DNA-binding response regulator [Paenibacillus oralis]